jgi:hypothetical protein
LAFLVPTPALVFLAQFEMPGEHAQAPRPESAVSPKYFEFLEYNAHIIYPVLAILVLVLLIAGIFQAWRAQDLDGLQKAEFKREIILELRKQMGGMSAESIARSVGLEPFKLVKLLEEMQKDGIVGSHTNTHRLTVWQLRGIGPMANQRY